MPNRMQQFFRRLKSAFNDIAFGADASRSTVQGHSGRVYWIPGTNLPWEELAGDLWEVPGVAACLGWMQRNLPQAPPQIVTGEGENERPVPNHPLLALLRQPNPEYDLNVLLAAMLLSWECRGDVYLAIDRARRSGLPTALWYVPHFLITPKRDKRSGALYYEYRIRGQRVRIEAEDIVHLRFGMDPMNPLCGLSPLLTAHRLGYVLQQGDNYAAKAMRNGGLVGGFVQPAEPKDASTIYDFDPERFIAEYSAKATGDRAGEIMAWSHPLKIDWPNVSPQDMAIDTMLDRPEATVAALVGLPPQVCGLHVGRLSKTFANQREAREIAWEEKLVPTGNAIYGQIGAKLLPQMSRNAERERCCLDIRGVRPLQPDLDALHNRARSDWMANLISRAEWARAVGREPEPGDETLYYRDVQDGQAAPGTETMQNTTGEGDSENG